MRLNKLFSESDARKRELQRYLVAEPNDQDVRHAYRRLLIDSGDVEELIRYTTEEELASDDNAIRSFAAHLENHILNDPSHERYLDLVRQIIEGMKEERGNFLTGTWNDKIESLNYNSDGTLDINRPERMTRLLVNLGDLIRATERPLDLQPRLWYIDALKMFLELSHEDLIRIAYQ